MVVIDVITKEGKLKRIPVDFSKLEIDGKKYQTKKEFDDSIKRILKEDDDRNRRDWIAAFLGLPIIFLLIILIVFLKNMIKQYYIT